MRKRLYLIVAGCFLVVGCAEEQKPDPAQEFKSFVKKLMERIETDGPREFDDFGISPFPQTDERYKLDLKKTNSVLTPYEGYIKFRLSVETKETTGRFFVFCDLFYSRDNNEKWALTKTNLDVNGSRFGDPTLKEIAEAEIRGFIKAKTDAILPN